MIGVVSVKMEDLIVEMKPKHRIVCLEKWKHFFTWGSVQLLKTDLFVSGSIQDIVKMNTELEQLEAQLIELSEQLNKLKEEKQELEKQIGVVKKQKSKPKKKEE